MIHTASTAVLAYLGRFRQYSKEMEDISPTKNDLKDARVMVKDGRYSAPHIPEDIYAKECLIDPAGQQRWPPPFDRQNDGMRRAEVRTPGDMGGYAAKVVVEIYWATIF